jgi:L-lactate utilization protein LutC
MSQLNPRERILNKLRAAQVATLPCPDAPAFYTAPKEDQATRVERLMLNMKNAMTEVHRSAQAGLGECITRICGDKNV